MSQPAKREPYKDAWRRHRLRFYVMLLPLLSMLPISMLMARYLDRETRLNVTFALMWLYVFPVFCWLLFRFGQLECPRCKSLFFGKSTSIREAFSRKEITRERPGGCFYCGLPSGALSDDHPAPLPKRPASTAELLFRVSGLVVACLKGAVLGVWMTNDLIAWKPLAAVIPLAEWLNRVTIIFGGAIAAWAVVILARSGEAGRDALRPRAGCLDLFGYVLLVAIAVLTKVSGLIIVPIFRGQVSLMSWVNSLNLSKLAIALLAVAAQAVFVGWLRDAALYLFSKSRLSGAPIEQGSQRSP